MKAKVMDNLCIGCGACAALTEEEEFTINDNGVAEAVNDTVKEENVELVKEAKENCPTSAIVINE